MIWVAAYGLWWWSGWAASCWLWTKRFKGMSDGEFWLVGAVSAVAGPFFALAGLAIAQDFDDRR